MARRAWSIAVLACLALSGAAPATAPVRTVRVAALANLNDEGFWPAVAARFEQQTGIRVEAVITGNKDAAPDRFRQGGIDLITMPAADPLITLVADGYATTAAPWVQTDLALVGPADDPAQVKGMASLAAAVRKILAGGHPLLSHASLGADVVLRAVLVADKGQIDPANPIVLLDDHQKHVLQAAVDRHAYTLISRVAFEGGKLAQPGYAVMVRGDPALRRPVLAATADARRLTGLHATEAAALLRFLLSPETQAWIAAYRNAGPHAVESPFQPVAAAP